MAKHSSTFVPLEAWCYHSPKLKYNGTNLDIGLFSESLLYYDQVFINIPNEDYFIDFIMWFIDQDRFQKLVELIEEEKVIFYHYGFKQMAAKGDDGAYHLVNVKFVDQSQEPYTFQNRFLDNNNLDRAFNSPKFRNKFKYLLQDKVIEVDVDSFEDAVNNARDDYINPDRNCLLLQSLVDDTYDFNGLSNPYEVKNKLTKQGSRFRVNYNLNSDDLADNLGTNLNFHNGTPLVGISACNRFIQSAMDMNCDLYLSSPMSKLVGDKLYESAYSVIKSRDIIENLEAEVEFPDVKYLVNTGRLNFQEVLNIRKKSVKFRNWLQEEGDRDRNALIAYHHEVAKESGFEKGNRIGISIFGVLSSAAAGILAETLTAGLTMGVVGAGVAAGGTYLTGIVSNMGRDWKPVVFGNWMKDRIEKIVEE